MKIPFEKGECMVEIFQRSFRTTPIMKNNTIYINMPPRKIRCNYISTTDLVILFCKVVDFGIFRRYINPILIKLNNNHNNYLNIKENRIISFDDTYYEGNALIVPFKKNIKEFEKINIIDFKKLVN